MNVFLSFLAVVMLAGCAAAEQTQSEYVAGGGATETPQRIVQRIATGNTEVLDVLEPTPELLEAFRERDPSWPYVLGRAYEERELPEAARAVYLEEAEQGRTLWAGWSLLRLARTAAREQKWVAAQGFAQRGVEIAPDNRDIWYYYGLSLYRQEQFESLISITDEMPRFESDSGHGEEISPGELAAERLLWRAVAAWELEQDREARFLEAFTRIPAQSIHSRLYLYLYYRDGALSFFSPEVRRLLELVYRSATEEHREARRLFLLLDPQWVASLVSSHTSREDAFPPLFATMARSAGDGHRAIERRLVQLGEIREEIVPAVRVLQARYADARGDRGEALARYGEAIELGRRDEIHPWVQMRIRAGDPLQEVLDYLNTWEADPAEYALAVDRLLPAIVRDRQWDELSRVYRALPPEAEDAYRQVTVVTALAIRDGYLDADTFPEIESRLGEARTAPAVTYYGLLARRLTEHPVELTEHSRDTTDDPASPEIVHIQALLAAGLVEDAQRRAMIHALTPEAARGSLELAHRFSRAGHISAALSIARRAVSRGPLPVTIGEIPLLYPRPFPLEIRAAAKQYELSQSVLYGLIREESHFNPRARSHVGATGLAQVMPATAEDLVRRMGWTGANLESVSDSIRMGSFYLALLADRMNGNTILQLAAYNAGSGRGRAWDSSFGDLSPELQVESVPFIETRWYLRRIAVSSAWYEHLLEGTDPAHAMPLFL